MAYSILILGAGRSSSSLISYWQERSSEQDVSLTVGDVSLSAAEEKVSGFGKAIRFDTGDAEQSTLAIRGCDLVISVLPAHLHPSVATICLNEKKHLITASYVSREMKSFHDDAKKSNLLFLNECGLDPGIDHMSAMQIIDRIKSPGGKLYSFESYTGGLIAPQTDPENPWRYKFTWNPRNVVMAGQGTARFLEQGQFKYIPYHQLFKRITNIHLPGHGDYEGYANRDSLTYQDAYGLHDLKTMIRGTLRNKGYCSAWDVLLQLGCTEDSYLVEGVSKMSHRDFINVFLPSGSRSNTEERVMNRFNLDRNGPEMNRLAWSGFFENENIGLAQGTPAQILEHILNKKWKLDDKDKDLVVMWHRFVFEFDGRKKEIHSSLIVQGEDSKHTAMAKTVGLPLAIAAKLLRTGKINARGVVIPTLEELYTPVLAELKSLGIVLTEQEKLTN
jgi:saccharopine dehydrogenase-like NADP-dependent oxidoreductase